MDLKYYMLTAQQQYFVPLGGAYTLALNAMADWGQSYGGKDYPIIKTVYAGGIGTVRGYEGSSLGARDPVTGDYLGGTRRVVANAQLYLPFPGASKDRTLRWFLFTDAGQVSAGSGLSCTTGKSRQPRGRSLRLAFLGGYRPVVAIADGSAAAVLCATAQRQAGRRQAGIPVPDRNRFLSCPVTLENKGRAGWPGSYRLVAQYTLWLCLTGR